MPFDLPEGESELIAGYLTEYSGFKYALFFLGEYLGLFAVTGLAVTLVSRRLAGARAVAGMVPFLGLVCRQIRRADFSFHLDAGDPAAIAPGPIVEFRLEIPGPARAGQPGGGGRLVMRRWQFPAALAVRWLLCAVPAGRSLFLARAGIAAAAIRATRNILMLNEIAFYLTPP